MNTILEQWKSGNGLQDELVIDGHIHIGAWSHAETFRNADEAASESVRYLDAHGIDAFCSLGGGYMHGLADYHIGNDFLLEVWRKMPERLIPFLSLNANDSIENLRKEMNRMYDAGVRCIKLINAYQANYPGDGPNLMAAYEFAEEHKMPVINHSWTDREIRKIAGTFKSVDFIFAHYGGGFQDAVMQDYSNVNANIWVYGRMGWLDKGIKKLGAKRFMLGSDGFLNSLSVGIGPIVFANASDDDKRLMLGLNLSKMLDIAGALPDSLKSRLLKIKKSSPGYGKDSSQ
jgi:uncharacterized protein